MKRFRIGWFSALLLLAAASAILIYWLPAGDPWETWPLAIDSATGTHRFAVELALTPEAQAQGLMYREDLPDDAGMLFVYDHPDVRTMWMKNTPLSLDMLFIDPDGVIRRIVRDTIPLSPSTIIGPRNILYVLELRAGVTRKLGIDTGDRIRNLPAPGQSSSSSSR
ncbi:MAG: DUF192 domain-containing protein [Gammaproteobacteria bacterium]|nr:DUF192 domain-containing protein [Gammaproteobacteria bacterium]